MKNDLERTDNRYKEGLLKRIANYILVGILWIVSLFPFWLLYLISEFLYYLVRYIFRYRLKVVKENLKYAFPEKSDSELKSILNGFYHHFADLILESVKLHGISKKQLDKRVRFEGIDLIDEKYKQGKSVIMLAMHYNNWEWCSFVQTKIKHLVLMLYDPVRGNNILEKFLLQSREKWGGKCIPIHHSARVVFKFHKGKVPTALWLGADQSAPVTSKFWTVFLNREAPFFLGPQKIAAKTNQPVFFHNIRKEGRGKYVSEFIPLIDAPAEIDSKKILMAYIRKMEQIIREEPKYYLWSHRKWKHKRPADIPLTV